MKFKVIFAFLVALVAGFSGYYFIIGEKPAWLPFFQAGEPAVGGL